MSAPDATSTEPETAPAEGAAEGTAEGTTPAAPPVAANGAAPATNGELFIEVDGRKVPNYAATIITFDEGDVVTGRVVRIYKDEVLVDIGWKSEGVIPAKELSIRRAVDPADEVSLDEEIDAYVLDKEDKDGRLILSKKRARFEKAWRRIEAAAESGEQVIGKVIEVVKGGLILDLGVRGFLPASLVDIRRVHDLDDFLGTDLECKVIELNRNRSNVVLSRRAVVEEERKEVREQILDKLEPGQIVEGKISNIVDFGAFVDLDGIDGLIHISELSWSHVDHPTEVVKIGDVVRTKVLDVNKDRQRISLGLKQTQEDPWQTVLDRYRPGDAFTGKVTKVVAFGAFVEIVPGVEGLVHISELAEHHVEQASEVVNTGDEVRVKVLEIDEERRRVSLSIRRIDESRTGALPLRDAWEEAQAASAASVPDGEQAEAPELGSDEVFAEAPQEPRSRKMLRLRRRTIQHQRATTRPNRCPAATMRHSPSLLPSPHLSRRARRMLPRSADAEAEAESAPDAAPEEEAAPEPASPRQPKATNRRLTSLNPARARRPSPIQSRSGARR